jgi:hypothetical protein
MARRPAVRATRDPRARWQGSRPAGKARSTPSCLRTARWPTSPSASSGGSGSQGSPYSCLCCSSQAGVAGASRDARYSRQASVDTRFEVLGLPGVVAVRPPSCVLERRSPRGWVAFRRCSARLSRSWFQPRSMPASAGAASGRASVTRMVRDNLVPASCRASSTSWMAEKPDRGSEARWRELEGHTSLRAADPVLGLPRRAPGRCRWSDRPAVAEAA